MTCQRGIRQRNFAVPDPQKLLPVSMSIEDHPPESHRPSKKRVPRGQHRLEPCGLESVNVNFDRGSAVEQFAVSAHHNKIEVVALYIASHGGPYSDQSKDIAIAGSTVCERLKPAPCSQ